MYHFMTLSVPVRQCDARASCNDLILDTSARWQRSAGEAIVGATRSTHANPRGPSA